METRDGSWTVGRDSLLARSALLLVAIVFAGALTFASVELPRLVNAYLLEHLGTPGFDSMLDPASVARAEAFVEYYHLRLFGYISLGLVLLLIAAGFATGRLGLASVGAVAFFLPVLGQFAATMFFLAGLGLLRVAWLPLLDTSYSLLALAGIVELPYRVAVRAGDLTRFDLRPYLPWVIMGLGMLVFVLGTLAWLRARFVGSGTVTALVYRYSRHPQYLGWIVWSYGLTFHVAQLRRLKVSWELSSAVPWLVSTLVIVGVALAEEAKMERERGEEYRAYARRTPFLLPLPRPVGAVLALPLRVVLRRDRPRTAPRIALALVVYTAVLVGVSALPVAVAALRRAGVPGFAASEATIRRLETAARQAPGRRPKFQAADALAATGERGVAALGRLLEDGDPLVRAFAADALGLAATPRAVALLAGVLRDPNGEVRFSAARALARIGSPEVVAPLVTALSDEAQSVRLTAALGLADLGWEGSADALLPLLSVPDVWTRTAAAAALGRTGSPRAIPPLGTALADDSPDVRRSAVLALGEIGGEAVVGPLSTALTDADPEVRRCATVALRRARDPGVLDTLRGRGARRGGAP